MANEITAPQCVDQNYQFSFAASAQELPGPWRAMPASFAMVALN